MKKPLLLTLTSMCMSLYALAQGINFETGDWKSVIEKARQSKRMVYVDVYTTWCGPCKILEKQIFPQKEAGDKFNAVFINYRIDAEKGEGIELAKKYAVNGYPTHLFIDPATETIVYRSMGASTEVSEFNEHADVALKEQKDPMTWDKYVAQHKAGKKDKAFLRAYLNKAKLLNKNNDAILNDYVAQLNTKSISDSEVVFLAGHLQTADNHALPIVHAHKEVVIRQHPEYAKYYDEMLEHWIYGTYEKAVANKNEGLLKVVDDSRLKYLGKSKDAETYYFRTQYYTAVGDETRAFKAGSEEAAFLTSKSAADYAKEDKEAMEDIKRSLRSQLEMMKVPAEKMDEMVQKNIASNPMISHSVSAQAATKLNSIAWQVYEKNAGNAAMVKQAIGWSSRSLELTVGLKEWPSFADTYAHLLYASGDKSAAIKMQMDAVNKAKEQQSEDASSLEESLEKMKSGTL